MFAFRDHTLDIGQCQPGVCEFGACLPHKRMARRRSYAAALAASVWVAVYQVQLSALESVSGCFAELVRSELPQHLQRVCP